MTPEQIKDIKTFLLVHATIIAIGGDAASEIPFSHMIEYIDSLLAAKDAEIEHLKMQVASIRGVHAIAVEKIHAKKNDPSAIVSIVNVLGTFTDQVADILNDKTEERAK